MLNMTQHRATGEQMAAGVVEPSPEVKEAIVSLLTVDALPSAAEVAARAQQLAAIAADEGFDSAMIGGAPWLMHPLHKALEGLGIKPHYAFSRRESVEETQPDGSIRKVAVFRHVGFV